MTPAIDYAQKRREAVELIQKHAPARLQDSLIELLRPAIALSATRADDDQIPIGASKFGGAPDVPEGFVWPMWEGEPLDFLGQINLEEVAPFDLEEELPKSGWLSFFASIESGGMGEDEENAKAFYFAQLSQRVFQPTEVFERDEIPFAVRLQPQIMVSMLNSTCAEFYKELGEPNLQGEYIEFPYEASTVYYQMFG